MKKNITLLLLFVSTLMLSQTFTSGFFKYSITSSRTVEVIEYIGTSSSIVIPGIISYNGTNYRLDSIGENCFRAKNLTAVNIPNGVTSIGNSAFMENDIASISLPLNLVSIGSLAFAFNDLTKLTIPSKVTSITTGAFHNNPITALTYLSASPTAYGNYFNITNGTNGIDLTIPKGTSTIYSNNSWTTPTFKSVSEIINAGIHTFSIVTSFTNSVELVNYGGSATTIDLSEITSSIFFNNHNFTVVYLGKDSYRNKGITNVNIGDIHPAIEISEGAFADNAINTLYISKRIVTIGEGAFANNQLTEVTIPENINTIGDLAFSGNTINEVTSKSLVPATLPANTFDNRNNINLRIPWGTSANYQAKGWTGFNSVLEVLTIGDFEYRITSTSPAHVEVVGYVGSATDITIPAIVTYNSTNYAVKSIGISAFRSKGLTSVDIPHTVTTIETFAFLENNLNAIEIPDNVTEIRNAAFAFNQLTKVTIPAKVDRIFPSVFGNNPIIAFTYLNPTPPDYVSLFNVSNGTNGIDLTVPKGTSSAYISKGWTTPVFKSISEPINLGVNTFKIITSYTNAVEITNYGGTATNIDNFQMSSSIVFNNHNFSVRRIGQDAYKNKGITNVNIIDSHPAVEIGEEAFADNAISSLYISKNITTIEKGAFSNNQLTEVTIPENITSLGALAFSGNALVKVTSESLDPAVLPADTFDNRSTIELVIPAGKETLYASRGWTGFKPISLGTEDTDVNTTDVSINIDSNTIEVLTNTSIVEEMNVYNIMGQRIANTTNSILSIDPLSNSIYILQVKTNKGVIVQKFTM